MGTRAQVFIKDTGVYLYQHYDGYNLYETVVAALKKKMRWDDPEYLARIIFDEMTKDYRGEEAGFGIGTTEQGDIEFLIEMDCERQMITHFNVGSGGPVKISQKSFSDVI